MWFSFIFETTDFPGRQEELGALSYRRKYIPLGGEL